VNDSDSQYWILTQLKKRRRGSPLKGSAAQCAASALDDWQVSAIAPTPQGQGQVAGGAVVRALQRFIQEQKQRLAESTWGPDLNAEAERLLAQFEAALRENRSRYQEIWSSLHSAVNQSDSNASTDEPTS
jgi:hypothetical protein